MPKPENVDKYGALVDENPVFNVLLRHITPCGTRLYAGYIKTLSQGTQGDTYPRAGPFCLYLR